MRFNKNALDEAAVSQAFSERPDIQIVEPPKDQEENRDAINRVRELIRRTSRK